MDSRTDIKAMRVPARLKAQGYAIADGIAAHFGLKQKVNNVTTAANDDEREVRYLQLNTRQADDMAAVFKLARDKGVFSSAQHESDVRAGKMTVDTAV
ncbi:hypothetical protein [Sporosarcina sp. ITBMC105]